MRTTSAADCLRQSEELLQRLRASAMIDTELLAWSAHCLHDARTVLRDAPHPAKLDAPQK